MGGIHVIIMNLTTKIFLASWLALCGAALYAKSCGSILHDGVTGGYIQGYEDGLKAGELEDKREKEKK